MVLPTTHTSAGGFATPGLVFTNSYQLADDFSWVKGSHQIAFGVNAIRPVQNGTFYVNPNGIFTFTGQITGLPLSDLLLGNLNSFGQNAISRDRMLANIAFYWFTGAIGSSFWPYYGRLHSVWPLSPAQPDFTLASRIWEWKRRGE